MRNNPTDSTLDLSKIKLAVFDFDGVFTDNLVYVDQTGNESVRCCRSDGVGLSKLRNGGIMSVVLSAEMNPVVEKRCAKLNVRCIVGCKDKLSALKKLLDECKLDPAQVCYVGNDLPDIECLKYVGFPITVKDSYPEVLRVAKYITKLPGGYGAVREVCDLICSGKQ